MDIGTEIYDLSLVCDEYFLRITKNQAAPSYVVTEVLHQRFQQWASNMGVFAREQLSLDARLAYSESLRSIVLQLLQIVKISLGRVEIESPQSAARETQSSVIEQMSRKPGRLSSLLIESLQVLESAVDGLHRLGAAIRQSSSAERLTQRIHNFIQKKDDGVLEDIVYARLKYQLVDKAKEDEVQTNEVKGASLSLFRQLAISVSYRYFAILYRRSHEDKKDIRRESKPVQEQKDCPDAVPKPGSDLQTSAPQDRPIENLTPIPRHLRKSAPERSESAPTIPNSTVARKQYASSQRYAIGAKSVVSIQLKDVKFPEPPKIIPPERFAPCPYCRQRFGKSEYEKEGWWKRHLQSDLKLYTCISEECHDPPQLFDRFEEWKSHMDKEHTPRWTVQVHMPVSWCCELDHDEEWFNEEQAFEAHVKDHHHEYSSDSELADLKELSMVRQPRQIYLCPVCNCIPEKIEVIISKAPESLTQERRDLREELLNHVKQHLIQIGFLTIAYLDDEAVGDSEASRNVSGRADENHDWVRRAKWVEGTWIFDDAGLSTYWDWEFTSLESEPDNDAKPPEAEEDWEYVWESEIFNGQPYSLEQTSRQVIEFAKEWRGPLDTLGCLKAFADWLSDNERLEEAEEVYLQRYELCVKVLGDENAATLESLEAVMNVRELTGKFEEAEYLKLEIARLRHHTIASSERGPEEPAPASPPPTDPWTVAYEIVQEREPELMIDYKKHLASVYGGDADLSTPRFVESIVNKFLDDREAKQWRVPLLDSDIRIREQVEWLVKFLLWSYSIVKTAVTAQPYAALAWSGASLLLPLLTSGATQNEAMLEGFHSIGDILVYWKICEKTYLQSSHRNDYQSLTETLAKLYSYIIEYQARVICHLSRAQLSRAWQGVAGSLDWTGKVGKIDTLDRTCRCYIPPLQDEEIREVKDRQLQAMQESQDILHEIRQVLADPGTQTQRLYDDQNERDLLRDLASDWERGKNYSPPRVEGTCEWFLSDKRFRTWRDCRTSALLWVSAGPGCGKSVLSRSLIDEGRLSTRVATSTVCYFFFKGGEQGRTGEADALSAILHQLFSQQVTGRLIRHALSAHKNFGHDLSRNASELWRILMDCTKSVDTGEIICVLDALDECDAASRKQIIDRLRSFYFQEQKTSKLKFLITSRPYGDLEASFRQFSATAMYVHFDGDEKYCDISHEISLVIDARLLKLVRNLGADDRHEISERLKSMENRTYLWLHLTFSIIEQDPSKYKKWSTIERLLSDPPMQISNMYETILGRSKNSRTVELLLQIVLIATRPLTLDEANISLTLALQKERFTSHAVLLANQWPPGNFKTVLKNLCGFISVYDSKIFFIHQTAREFLTAQDQQIGWKGSLSLQASHRTMSLCCLHYLMLPDFATVQDAPEHQYPFMEYAGSNWAFHFRSQAVDQADKNDARELCRVLGPRARLWRPFLVNQDNNIWQEDWASWPDLTFASYLGLASVVNDIITKEHADVNAHGGYYSTALYAATTRGFLKVLEILLKPSNKVYITEDVVKAAAGNRSSGEEILELFFKKRVFDVKITKEVVKIAACNKESGNAIIRLLLDTSVIWGQARDKEVSELLDAIRVEFV